MLFDTGGSVADRSCRRMQSKCNRSVLGADLMSQLTMKVITRLCRTELAAPPRFTLNLD